MFTETRNRHSSLGPGSGSQRPGGSSSVRRLSAGPNMPRLRKSINHCGISLCSLEGWNDSVELDWRRDTMQFPKVRTHMVLALLFLSWSVWAQETIDREAEIHKNVKLVILAPAPDIPGDIAAQYKSFIPVFQEALSESIGDQTDECGLTIRLAIGVKEIGAAKVKRPMARVTAFRRNSRQEYVATFILYSYATQGLVSKEETQQFLKKQILDPAECKKSE